MLNANENSKNIDKNIKNMNMMYNHQQHLIFPRDCLEDGRIKSSEILALADILGGIITKRYSKQRTVTSCMYLYDCKWRPKMSNVLHLNAEIIYAKNYSMEILFKFTCEDILNSTLEEFGSCYALYVVIPSPEGHKFEIESLGENNQQRDKIRKLKYQPINDDEIINSFTHRSTNEDVNTLGILFGGNTIKIALKNHEDILFINGIYFICPIYHTDLLTIDQTLNGSFIYKRNQNESINCFKLLF